MLPSASCGAGASEEEVREYSSEAGYVFATCCDRPVRRSGCFHYFASRSSWLGTGSPVISVGLIGAGNRVV